MTLEDDVMFVGSNATRHANQSPGGWMFTVFPLRECNYIKAPYLVQCFKRCAENTKILSLHMSQIDFLRRPTHSYLCSYVPCKS